MSALPRWEPKMRWGPFKELEEMEKRLLNFFGHVPGALEEKNKKYHRVERSYGSFMRSFSLPEDADGTKVAAEYKDGVLKVHLPKSEKSQPKAIEVKVA